MSATRTVSKLAYLLGVTNTTLSKYYKDLSLEEMESNSNAVYLRALCRVRQTLLKNYRKLDHCIRSLHSMNNITDDLVVIECRDNQFKRFKDIIDVCEIINYITHSINEILSSTLSSIEGIKDDKNLIAYFEYPIYTHKLLGEHHDYFKDGHLPHGLICPLSINLNNMQGFSYALLNEETVTANALLIAPYSKLLYSNDDSESTIEISSIANSYENIYVDCDNTKIVDLVSFVNDLQKRDINPTVYLFLDNRSNFLWHNFEEIFPNIKTSIIPVNRIKVLKSVVDMYLSSYILQDILVHKKKYITVFSSDSDYYGLWQFLSSQNYDVTINVVYNRNMICQDYVSVLKALPYIIPKTVSNLDRDVKEMCISILTAFSMLRDAGSNWVIDKVCKYISSMLLGTITPEMISRHFDSITVKPDKEGMVAIVGDFKITSPKEGQPAKVVRLC